MRAQGNLKEEQQVFMKANTVLLTQLLSPVQAALLMLQCWPAHCDCFGFANFVASEVGPWLVMAAFSWFAGDRPCAS